MESGLVFWLLAYLAAFFVGCSKGGLQLLGTLAVPILALQIPAGEAAGLILPIYILSDWYGLWIYRREFSKRNIWILIPAGAIGILFGWATAHVTDENVVKLLVAVIAIAYLIYALWRAWKPVEPKPADVPRGIFWGAIAGFTSFVSHAGAPPFNMYVLPQRLPKMVYAGTSTIVFAAVNAMKLPPYWMLGQVSLPSLEICAYLAPMALFGAWSGYKLTGIIPEKIFIRTVELSLLVIAYFLLRDCIPPLWHSWIG